MEELRLQKYLAICGIGSRRTCELYISQGRVKVDGEIVTKMGTKINPSINRVTFEEKEVCPQKKYWIMINKPPEYICSSKKTIGKKSILSLIPTDLGRLYTVGRLDFMSEGLLLITNDGDMAYRITHPRYEVKKVYEVETIEKISDSALKNMLEGVLCENENLRLLEIQEKRNKTKSFCYIIKLNEGRYRHIRRILASFNIHILKLKRTSIGQIHLGNLKKGKWRFLSEKEIDLLKKEAK